MILNNLNEIKENGCKYLNKGLKNLYNNINN